MSPVVEVEKLELLCNSCGETVLPYIVAAEKICSAAIPSLRFRVRLAEGERPASCQVHFLSIPLAKVEQWDSHWRKYVYILSVSPTGAIPQDIDQPLSIQFLQLTFPPLNEKHRLNAGLVLDTHRQGTAGMLKASHCLKPIL